LTPSRGGGGAAVESSDGLQCTRHKKKAEMVCECKMELLCPDCYNSHQGVEHKKFLVQDMPRNVQQILSTKISDADKFLKKYN